MKLSAKGRRLIKGFESLSLTAYPDGDGHSIGYGHLGADEGDVITLSEAEALFDADVLKYEASVNDTVSRPMTQDQYDAMVSLAYNVGTAGFAGSTVARLMNAGNVAGAADAFRMWRMSEGQVDPVLVERREDERAYFLTGALPNPNGTPRALPQELAPGMRPALPGLALAASVALLTYLLLPKAPFGPRVLAFGS